MEVIIPSSEEKANRLIHESSPYLLQHAHNPVDWFPWSKEAFEKAASEDKPVFLSIGYATCHWCHEMAHDSFENEDVAAILNNNYISIKVDREERPDIDSLYMDVCQAFTGSGGWPMTIIMTPEKKPFFAGTFFFANDRYGQPGLKTILIKLNTLWQTERKKITESTRAVMNVLKQRDQTQKVAKSSELGQNEIAAAARYMIDNLDPYYGGFSNQGPKFPLSHMISLLLRYIDDNDNATQMIARKAARFTLVKTANGGIYDQIGGGFHRYSVDRYWLVPHFEKMLYDQALLSRTYAEAYKLFGDEYYRDTTRGILDYVIRDLSDEGGAFYSAEDADSEGVEGKFYVWSKEEIREFLDDKEFDIFCEYYGVLPEGNFEGKNILNIRTDISELANNWDKSDDEIKGILLSATEKLFEQRQKRVRPFLDDKILSCWNGLMISSMAYASSLFDDDKYYKVAKKAASFIIDKMFDGKKLFRMYREGHKQVDGFLDDYAFFCYALVDLFEIDSDPYWLDMSSKLANIIMDKFDDGKKGLSFTSADNEELIAKPSADMDGALPSPSSIASLCFLKIDGYISSERLRRKAEEIISANGPRIKQFPQAFTQMLIAVHFKKAEGQQIAIVDEYGNLAEEARYILRKFLPNKLIVRKTKDTKEIGQKIDWLDGKDDDAIYICKGLTCHPPVKSREQIDKILAK